MKRRVLKIIACVSGSIIILLTAFHIWFIHHAEDLLENLVASQSNGKLRLQVKHFRFNWFSHYMQLRQAVFYSTDTATATTAYRFSVERINISVREVFPLVFEKRFIIDSLKLVNPDIRVTRLRPPRDSDSTDNKTLSLPQEMGRVYKSIQDALQVLSVTKFHIDNGRFTLINKIRPDDIPVTISNIQLHLDNLKIDTSQSASRQKILFSDNVALQTSHQDIVFPDGRHRLSFSNFGINIAKKLVEFDSCTIVATREDSSQTSFRIFFDKLRLTNIDFDTLYLKEVIKADSVYCINPRFRLDTESGKRQGPGHAPPKLNELIQQMTGDLRIESVIVQNGSFDINTVRDGKPSSFTSSNNNFEMKGLRIDQASSHPLTVRSLAMAIRNYENFLRDSTYALQFDSVLLVNNSINLSNFSVQQFRDGKTVNNVSIPHFQLMNFSWDDLVFQNQLSAGWATLYRPTIDYSFARKDKRQDLFRTLAGIGEIVQLNDLYVTDGHIRLLFTDGTRLELEGAQLFLAGRDFVRASQARSLQQAIRTLRFRKGTLRSAGLDVHLENASITGADGRLSADRLSISSRSGDISIDAGDVVIGSISPAYGKGLTAINNIQWKNADVRLTASSAKNKLSWLIRNLDGYNTRFSSISGDHKLYAWFHRISATEFAWESGGKVLVTDLHTTGRSISYSSGGLTISMDAFQLADHAASFAKDLVIESTSATDSLLARIPSVDFIPDINAILRDTIRVGGLRMIKPVIQMKNMDTDDGLPGRKLPLIDISTIDIEQPDFLLQQPGNSGFSLIEWHSRDGKNNTLHVEGLTVNDNDGIRTRKLSFSLADFQAEVNGRKLNAGKGELTTDIDNFRVRRNDAGAWNWHAGIKDLQAINFLFDNLGKNAGRLYLKSIDIDNLDISSSTILNFRQMLMSNQSFRISKATGTYETARTFFSWKNAAFDKQAKSFSVDSFAHHPSLPKNEYLAGLKFQADYTTLQTEKIKAENLDIDKYLGDTILSAANITIDGLVMENYRDKHLPFRHGVVKQLPVAALARIPLKVDVSGIRLNNARVSYAELNNKTNETGTVTFSNMSATIKTVSNMRHTLSDSLQIRAEALLLDSFPIAVTFRQSYADTAGGFNVMARIDGGNARLFSPVTSALGSVRIESGTLDSLSMQVTGSNQSTSAQMKMIYYDLRIRLLNNTSSGSKKKTSKGLASFVANTFAIKNKNRSRTVQATFVRVKEKSVFHYLWKTTLKAIAASIGLKKS